MVQEQLKGPRDAHRADCFVGREEVAFELDAWLNQDTSWVLVSGSPGSGKSALLAHYLGRLETAGITSLLELTRRHLFGEEHAPPAEWVLGAIAERLHTKKVSGRRAVPHAFIEPKGGRTWTARQIAQAVATQVEALFPECGDPSVRDTNAYLAGLLSRSSELLKAADQRLILVIDGIDQCADGAAAFAGQLPFVPPNISVVCSSRPLHADEFHWMRASDSFGHIDLDSRWAPSNHDVCRRYAEKLREQLPPGVDVDQLLAAAAGCIRYLVDLADMLREHPAAPLERVPLGFRGYLEQLWDGINDLDAEPRACARRGLEPLASAGEPMSRSAIAERAGWPGPGLADTFVRAARHLLIEESGTGTDPQYRLFHPAFAQFISETLLIEHSGIRVRDASRSRTSGPRPIVGPIKARYLLAIGVDDYVEHKLNGLGFCGNDALAMAELLGSNGYTATTLHDGHELRAHRPTLLNIGTALRALERTFGPEDFLWVHFSCHGLLAGNHAYLLAADSRSCAPETTGLAVENVVHAIKASGSARWLLTLDACHSGVSGTRDASAPGTPNSPAFEAAFINNVYECAQGGAILAASTAAQEAADSEKDRHGVFTHAMLQALGGAGDRGNKGFVTVDDLKVAVIDGVRRWSFANLGSGLQTPSFKIEGTGDIILLDRRPPAP